MPNPNYGRIPLAFNLDDPAQKKAYTFLKKAGHGKKVTLVTMALNLLDRRPETQPAMSEQERKENDELVQEEVEKIINSALKNELAPYLERMDAAIQSLQDGSTNFVENSDRKQEKEKTSMDENSLAALQFASLFG